MANCTSCGKEIYFLITESGRFIPVNAESLTSAELRDCQEGLKRQFAPFRHITHFSDCPDSAKYRNAKSKE